MKSILKIAIIFLSVFSYAQVDFNTFPNVLNKSTVGSGDQTLVLDDINTYYDDEHIILKNNGAGSFTVNAAVGETIDKKTSIQLRGENSFYGIVKDPNLSTNWTVIEHYESAFFHELGSGFLADPNEFNGWGSTGLYDDLITHDLGEVGANTSRVAGGISFPFDVKLKNFYAWHYNNNNALQAWGWRINMQTKNAASNVVVNTEIFREVVGQGAGAVAPRNYSNTTTQFTEIPFDFVIPAGSIITLGIEAPTAIATNRYVFIMSGWFEFEKM